MTSLPIITSLLHQTFCSTQWSVSTLLSLRGNHLLNLLCAEAKEELSFFISQHSFVDVHHVTPIRNTLYGQKYMGTWPILPVFHFWLSPTFAVKIFFNLLRSLPTRLLSMKAWAQSAFLPKVFSRVRTLQAIWVHPEKLWKTMFSWSQIQICCLRGLSHIITMQTVCDQEFTLSRYSAIFGGTRADLASSFTDGGTLLTMAENEGLTFWRFKEVDYALKPGQEKARQTLFLSSHATHLMLNLLHNTPAVPLLLMLLQIYCLSYLAIWNICLDNLLIMTGYWKKKS